MRACLGGDEGLKQDSRVNYVIKWQTASQINYVTAK